MRSTFVLLILGAAVACGDSNNSTPDAPKHPDANQNDAAGDAVADATPDGAPDAGPDAAPDGAIDAGPDAPNDGGMAPMSRVWVTGDYATNNVTQAGWFDDGATLPVTPTQVPPAPAVLPRSSSGHPYTSNVFDAVTTKTAYVADVTTAGTFDLYAADADGTNPTLLVAGAANLDIVTIALSPDGTKVAYLMDSATYDNAFDVWVVNTTGTPVPLLVSPARPLTAPTPGSMGAFTGSLTWSADSKYIGFSGDFTTDNVFQPYAVDTTAAAPAAVTLMSDTDVGTNDTKGDVVFDSNGKAYFRIGTGTQFALYQVGVDGQNLTSLPLPMRGDNTTSSAGTFAISPDSTMIAFSADTTAGMYDLYVTPIATWNPVKLTNNTLPSSNPSFNVAPAFSPDGTKLAIVADFVTDNVFEPYVVGVDGSGLHRVVNVVTTNGDADFVAWTADGTHLYIRGDMETTDDTTLFLVDPTMTDVTPTKAMDVTMGGDLVTTRVVAK